MKAVNWSTEISLLGPFVIGDAQFLIETNFIKLTVKISELLTMLRKCTKDIIFPWAWRWCTVLKNELFYKQKTNANCIDKLIWTAAKISILARTKYEDIQCVVTGKLTTNLMPEKKPSVLYLAHVWSNSSNVYVWGTWD